MESNTLPLTDLFLGLFPLIGFTSDSQKNKNNTFFLSFYTWNIIMNSQIKDACYHKSEMFSVSTESQINWSNPSLLLLLSTVSYQA